MSSAEVARRGVALAMEELRARGARVERDTSTRGRNYLRAKRSGGAPSSVYVKTRRVGDWQTDMRKGQPRKLEEDPREFWLFVDLTSEPPEFFVAPAWWVENHLYEDFQAYIASHGGRRAHSPNSTHQRITTEHIEQWRGRWDVLGFE